MSARSLTFAMKVSGPSSEPSSEQEAFSDQGSSTSDITVEVFAKSTSRSARGRARVRGRGTHGRGIRQPPRKKKVSGHNSNYYTCIKTQALIILCLYHATQFTAVLI